MKFTTANAFLTAAEKIQAIEERLSVEIVKLEGLNDEYREDDDVFDDLCYFRDSIRKAREDMEHRIADAHERVT